MAQSRVVAVLCCWLSWLLLLCSGGGGDDRWTTITAAAAATNQPSSTFSPPIGLRNLGNTCYMNAQLQCAYHVPLVRRLILHGAAAAEDDEEEEEEEEVDEDVDEDDGTVATSMIDSWSGSDIDDDEDRVQDAASTSSSSTSSTTSVKTATPTTRKTLPSKEDSIALQSLRQVFANMMDASGSSSTATPTPRSLCTNLGISVWEQQDAQEFWKLLLPALQFPALQQLYQGQYQDYITALDGSGRQKETPTSFSDLSLDIIAPPSFNDDDNDNQVSSGSGSGSSIQSSLQSLFGPPELLTVADCNGWRPERNAPPVDAHKGWRLVPTQLPSILQLHLKRFQFDWSTERTTKLFQPVSFPRSLDLSGLAGQEEDSNSNNKDRTASLCRYELQSVVVHVGEYGSGHYYAYVRPNVRSSSNNDDDDNEVWYRFNDDVVDAVTWQDVIRDAYGGCCTDTAESSGSPSSTECGQRNNNLKQPANVFSWLWSKLLGQQGGNSSQRDEALDGYGGPKSCAYVLQYVRQCDIPKLYDHSD